MNKIHVAKNALDPSEWTEHETDLGVIPFLIALYGDRFPETARIFHQYIATDCDVTPHVDDPESIPRLAKLTGTFWVIEYPAGAAMGPYGLAGQLVVMGGLLIAANTFSWLTRPDKKPPPPKLQPITGSPNNKLGQRANTGRALGRIPDIYGIVRSTPDLLQQPYTVYVDNRETEVCYFCVGRGEYVITDIREGDMLVNQIEGMSVAVYGPGDIPGSGSPQSLTGDPIPDVIYVVRTVEAVNGQPMLAPNQHTFIGDIPSPGSNLWFVTQFKHIVPGLGLIHVGGTAEEIAEKVKVGDLLDIVYPVDRMTAGEGLNPLNDEYRNPLDTRTGNLKDFTPNQILRNLMRVFQTGTGPLPDLNGTGVDAVTVLAVDTSTFFNLAVSIPASKQAAWTSIGAFTFGLFDADIVGNGGSLITAQGHEWIGPFFVEHLIILGGQQLILCNFVAQEGLFADDGKNQAAFSVRIEIEITPADANGVPTADPVQIEEIILTGSQASRNTRGVTAKIVPLTQGNFLIRSRRLTRTPWKQDSPSQNLCLANIATGFPGQVVPALALTGDRVGKNKSTDAAANSVYSAGLYKNSSYLPFYGNSHDEIRWTHCYAMSTLPVSSLGNITTIHSRTIATIGATSIQERRLNCIAYRQIQTWNGSTFGGALTSNNNCENVLFTILKDPKIGDLDDSLIDFSTIAAAFDEVRAAFGGPTSDGFGGDEAGQFNYTFDNEELSLEDTIGIICQAGFCVPYRVGDFIKARSEIATTTAELLVNHRNKLPGTEERTLNFGTEADYDGVRIEYVDTDINSPTNDAVKTYSIPPSSVALRPKVIEVPGIRLKKHAAWHAWRAYYKLLFQNMVVQFQACQEAMHLTLMSRFLLSDGTRSATSASIQEGEVVAVSGLTITTSQPVAIPGPGTYTIFLQHVDGTVQSIAVASSPNGRQITLATAPAVTLATDSDTGLRTMYILVKDSFVPPKAFLVQERSCTGKGTYAVTATNYAHAYYWNDGLMFWLPFITQSGLVFHRDWGPYELSTSSTGTTAVDGTRGNVYAGVAAGDFISITTSNVFASQTYTKSAWVNWDGGVRSAIISSPSDQDEEFVIASGGELRGQHSNVAYCQFPAFPSATWKMVTLTYNHVTLIMRMYVDDILVDTATAVPGRPIGNLRIFGGGLGGTDDFMGRGDEVRYWMRELQAEEVKELYQRTRL